MPADSFPASNQLKDWFSPERYRSLALQLTAIEPRFDQAEFLRVTLHDLASRELKARLQNTVVALHASLPGPFLANLAVLRQLAPQIKHTFIAVALSDYVAVYGLAWPKLSLPALAFFTRFGSAEFAIRAFLEQDQARTLAVMFCWTQHRDEHVRRLASEGSRPRLPWGQQLRALVRNPRPTFDLLSQLRDDPSLYVRKSVANHLNDIAKDHPDLMLALVESWDNPTPATRWIVQHGLRTLIKQGHPRALALSGVEPDPAIEVVSFQCAPVTLGLGETLTIETELASQSSQPTPLIIDYVVHYVKASGSTSAKVFKWKGVILPPHQSVRLSKRQTLRDFSTRKHHAGRHRVELQINGKRLAAATFDLET
jgi:3-methyladenine DNA glycosylase AlkC